MNINYDSFDDFRSNIYDVLNEAHDSYLKTYSPNNFGRFLNEVILFTSNELINQAYDGYDSQVYLDYFKSAEFADALLRCDFEAFDVSSEFTKNDVRLAILEYQKGLEVFIYTETVSNGTGHNKKNWADGLWHGHRFVAKSQDNVVEYIIDLIDSSSDDYGLYEYYRGDVFEVHSTNNLVTLEEPFDHMAHEENKLRDEDYSNFAAIHEARYGI